MLWVVLSVLYTLDPRDCYTNLPKLVEKCIGDYIVITPDFVGYPSTPELDWTNIPGDGRHKVHQNGTLVFTNAQVEDSELYSYLVHSEDEFTLTFFNLSVTDCGNMVEPTSVVDPITLTREESSVTPTREKTTVTPTRKKSSVTPTEANTRDFASVTSTGGDFVTETINTKELPQTTEITEVLETEVLPTTTRSLAPHTRDLPSTPREIVSSDASDSPISTSGVDAGSSTEKLVVTTSKDFPVTEPMTERLTSPPTERETTSPKKDKEISSPPTESVTTSPKKDKEISSPLTESVTTSPKKDKEITSPPTESVTTSPKKDKEITSPKTEGGTTGPKEITSPKTERETNSPKTESVTTSPKKDKEITSPPTESVTTMSPKKDKEITSPKTEKGTTGPKTESVTTGPKKDKETSPQPESTVTKSIVITTTPPVIVDNIEEEYELLVQDVTVCYGSDTTVNIKLVKKSDQSPYEGSYTITWQSQPFYNVVRTLKQNELRMFNVRESGDLTISVKQLKKSETIRVMVTQKEHVNCEGPAVDTVLSSQYTEVSTRSRLTVIPSYEPNTSEEPIVTDSAVKEVTSSPMKTPKPSDDGEVTKVLTTSRMKPATTSGKGEEVTSKLDSKTTSRGGDGKSTESKQYSTEQPDEQTTSPPTDRSAESEGQKATSSQPDIGTTDSNKEKTSPPTISSGSNKEKPTSSKPDIGTTDSNKEKATSSKPDVSTTDSNKEKPTSSKPDIGTTDSNKQKTSPPTISSGSNKEKPTSSKPDIGTTDSNKQKKTTSPPTVRSTNSDEKIPYTTGPGVITGVTTSKGPDISTTAEPVTKVTVTPPVVPSSSALENVYLQFTVQPNDVDTFAGLTVRLDCAAQGKPLPIRVFWLIGNRMLTNSSDVILHGNGSLVLHNVAAEDSGNYACIAENGDLSILANAHVNVNIPKFVGVDVEGNLFVKDAIKDSCREIPSSHKFKAITAHPGSGQLYGVDDAGALWVADSFLGPFTQDDTLPAKVTLKDVAVGPGDVLYAIDKPGNLWTKLNSKSWKRVKNTGGKYRSISFFNTGELLAVVLDYKLMQKSSADVKSAWKGHISVPFKLNHVAVYDNKILGITSSNELVYRNQKNAWVKPASSCPLVAITPITIDSIPLSEPEITSFSGVDLVVPVGASVTLTCTVFGIPTPTTVIQPSPAQASYEPQNTVSSTVSTVQIFHDLTSSQHYECLAVSPAGTDSEVIHVVVYEPLEWETELSDTTVVYTDEPSSFVGVPNIETGATINWFINDKPVLDVQNETHVSLNVSNGDTVRCEVETPYDKIVSETTVVVIDLPLVGIIDGSVHICTNGEWVRIDEDEDTKLKYITTGHNGSFRGIELGTDSLITKKNISESWEPLNMCCYSAVASVDSATAASFSFSPDSEVYLVVRSSSLSLLSADGATLDLPSLDDVINVAVREGVVLAVNGEYRLFVLKKQRVWQEVSLPFRPLTIHYSVPTKQWLAVDSETRDVYLADDDVVDDVSSLSWFKSDRCSGSDGAMGIPVDGVAQHHPQLNENCQPQISLQGERAPSIISLNPDEELPVGTDYTLILVVDAFPPPTIIIKHVDKTGKETIIVEEITDNMVSVTVHEIEGVELGDGGVFICIAENKLGGDESRTTLTVGSAPEFEVKPQSVVTSDPQQVNLLCIAKGTPTPEITWYFNGDKIDDVSAPGYLLSFVMTEETTGIYSCVAKNTFGTITAEAKTSIEDPVIIGVEDDSLFKQPVNSSCQMVDSVSLYLDVAVSGNSILLVGLDNELYRASDIDSVPVHIHDSCCVRKLALVGDRIYGITPTNWLVSWNQNTHNWDVHMFGEQVQNIESHSGALYISTDGVSYKKCDDSYNCSDDGVTMTQSRDYKVNRNNKVVRYNDLRNRWQEVSMSSISTEMRSIATSSSGKIYAVGDDGHLYVRTSLTNDWHRTLDEHTGFTAVEVDCVGTIWVLKNGVLFSVIGNQLQRHTSLLNLQDFSTYKAGFVAISSEGDIVVSKSSETLVWEIIESAGSLISIDSYQHYGLLGVYPDRLKVKTTLDSPWVEYSGGCGLTDATELVSASYCNGTAPQVKLDVVSDPELDSDGNLVDPYTPQPDSLAKVNTDIMLIGYVVYTGPEPNVYMTFKGVIIPTTIVNKDDTSITVTYYISSITFDNEGDYVIHADNGDYVSTDSSTITVYDTFSITVQPLSQSTYISGNIVLKIQATSSTELIFVWTKVGDDGTEEVIDNDKTHSSVRDNGDLHIYDIQAYHEAGYFCTVSNGRDSVKSEAVKVTIIEPQYLATLGDGNMYISPDHLTFYPIFITTGVLDAAVYQQVLYLVLADYQVYTYPLTGRQEYLTLLPDSCCVNSIAVYSELGAVKLLATDVSTFDLLHRRIDGTQWVSNKDSLTSIAVVSDEMVATQRTSGYSLFKTGIGSMWKPTITRIPMLHIVGHYNGKIIGVGYDRRLHTAADYTDSWTRIPGFTEVECAAIDNEGGMIYIVLTTGEIKKHKITELDEQKKTRGSVIFKPDFKVLHVSWEGTLYYSDTDNRLLISRAYTTYPTLHQGISFAYSVVSLPDTYKTILVLNKRGIHNVTETGSVLLRPLSSISSMSLNGPNLILTHKDDQTIFSLPFENIRFGRLVEISRVHITRLFSTPEIMGSSPGDDVTDDDVTKKDDDVMTDGGIVKDDDDDDKEAAQGVVLTWNGSQWEMIEGSDITSMAYFTVLRINCRTSTILSPAVTYYVELGDNIQMMCSGRGTPTNTQTIIPRNEGIEDVKYRGYYRTEDIALMEHIGSLQVSTVTSIIRIQAEENMVEWYRCTASNMYGTDFQDFRVVIWRKLIYIETPENTVIDEGTHHVLLCAADALPVPAITWFKDKYPVEASESVIPLKTGGLLLAPANIHDSGTYQCVAQNSRESISIEATVFVKRPIEFTLEPEDVTVKSGQEVRLSVNVIGHPEPVITWSRKSGEEIPASAEILPDGTLVLTSTDGSDSDDYICTATNNYESVNVTVAVQINEPEVPIILTGPEDRTVFIGTKTKITCIASGDPLPQIYILKKGIPQQIDVTFEDDGTVKAVLTMKIRDASQSGAYTCNAVNGKGSDSEVGIITVFEEVTMSLVDFSQSDNDISTPDDITIDADDVTKKIPDDVMIYGPSMNEDTRITIVAKVEGAPRPDITWTLYNKVLEPSDKYLIAPLNKTHYTLTITNFNEDDVGEYSASATNSISTDSQTVVVNVETPVGFTEWSSCDVTCGLGVQYRQETCTETLNGETALCQDTSNSQERVCKMPACPTPPVIESFGVSEEIIPRGDSVILSCEVSGSAPISVVWKKGGVEVKIDQRVTIFNNDNVYMLKITNATVSDSGEYTVTAVNYEGEDEESMDIIVILTWSKWTPWGQCSEECDGGTRTRSRVCENSDTSLCPGNDQEIQNCNNFDCERSTPVIIVPVDDVVGEVGGCVTFTCHIGSVPNPDVTWWRGDGQLSPIRNTNTNITLEDGYSTLELCDLSIDDAECYNCLGVNSEGVNMTTGMLKVVAPPQITTPPQDQSVTEGMFVELVCETTGLPQPEVRWLLNGKTFSSRYVLQADDLLRFTNISVSQQGTYTCEAQNSAGTTFSRASVEVTAVDGNWGDWSGYSTCSEDCGYGDQTRKRLCNNPRPSQSGEKCPGEGEESRDCIVEECPAEVAWSDWSEWSDCDPSCGLGNHTRVRTCLNGDTCEGEEFITATCYTAACPVNGGYSIWSPWSTCSEECGGGNQTRTRTCTDPRPAHGGKACVQERGYEIKQCNSHSCPVKPRIVRVPEDTTANRGEEVTFLCSAEGVPTPMITWFEDDIHISAITTTSGQRITSYLVIQEAETDRTFNCLAQNEAGAALVSVDLAVTKQLPVFSQFPEDMDLEEDQDLYLNCEADEESEIVWMFNNKPLTEYFSEALALSNGTLLIQDATRFHTGRYDCIATNDVGTSDKSAYITVNPIHGEYSAWEDWSNCSVSCGDGEQTRTRTCNNPVPSTNGLQCNGPDKEKRACAVEDCEDVVQYGEWSECSETCGGGIRSRIVDCAAADCPRVGSEECNTNPCPVNGNYTDWTAWSKCSVDCGGGVTTRSRVCKNPRPSHGGLPCPGPNKDSEVTSCNLDSCPRNTQLIGPPQSLTVPVGSDVTFVATYLGIPTPVVAWLVDGQPIVNSDRIFVETVENDGLYTSTLTVRSVDPSDEKIYSIILTSSNKKPILATATLTTTQAPEIVSDVTSVAVEEGEDIVLNCEVESRPVSMVSWTPLTGSSKLLSNHTLLIQDSKITDAGMYTCTAMNSVGSDSKIIVVSVRAINGGLTDWSAWSDCTVSCGSGTKTRTRTCTSPEPSHSGRTCSGDLEDTRSCANKPCAVDGGYSAWDEWTPCSETCGLGKRTRNKTCTNPAPAHGGKDCTSGETVNHEEICFEANCPVDGGWTQWTLWTTCSVTCGGGSQTRSRSCTRPLPMFDGEDCGPEDPETESRACNEEECPEHPIVFTMADQEAEVGDRVQFVCRIHAQPKPSVIWMRNSEEVVSGNKSVITTKTMDETTTVSKLVIESVESEDEGMYVCLATNVAGSNIENAALTVNDPNKDIPVTSVSILEGDSVTLACVAAGPVTWNLDQVPLSPGSRFVFVENNLVISDSTIYISGTYTCKEDTINRKRYDVKITAVNGGLSDWDTWSPCVGVGCGVGQKTRTRQCNSPTPSSNGVDCVGDLTDKDECDIPCRSEWSDWTQWNGCSADCGGGYQSRNRVCITQGNNGTCTAPGSGTEVRNCNTKPCSVNGQWSDYSAWSDCSVTCGDGVRTRTKTCDNPAPAAGGNYCEGQGSETKTCSGPVCPTHGNWGEWSGWSSCSVDCGKGVKSRERVCDNPEASDGGDPCAGSAMEFDECIKPDCDEEGKFTEWSDWTECHSECGAGTQSRARECVAKKKRTQDSAVTCAGQLSQFRVCDNECVEITSAPESIFLNKGETAILECEVSDGEVIWYKGGEELFEEENVRIYNRKKTSRLQISDVISSDDATYTCSVTVGNNTDRATASITVLELPEITFMSEEQRVREGDSVTIECVARGIPAPGVSITRYEELQVTSAPRTSADDRTYEVKETLKIVYVTPGDEGEYVCTAVNERGVEEKSSAIIIVVDGTWSAWSDYSDCNVDCGTGTKSRTRTCSNPAPRNGGDSCPGDDMETVQCSLYPCDYGPVFVVKPVNLRVTAGERIEIPVVVDAQPAAEITWLTPGGPAAMLEGFQVIPENTTLVIEEVDLRDSGVYKVLASNDEGVAEYAFTIIVEGKKPIFVSTLQNVTVTTGTALQMTVTATGNPLPRIEFFRTIDGAPVKLSAQTMTMTRRSDLIGSRYSISVLSLADEGEYYATAVNEYGTAVTKGYVKVVQDVVPAQVSILVPTPLKVIYGDEVKIPIEVSGIPTPTISWDTPGGEIEEEDDGSLVIPVVTPEHEGVYTITANNTSDGEPETETLRLVIVGRRPEFVDVPEDQEILRNEDLTLSIKVVGLPLPSLALTGPNGENIPLSLELDEENDAVIGQAEIDTSLLSNSGVYKITAENKHGSAEEEIELTILSDTSAPKFNSSVYSLQLFHGQSGSIQLGVNGKPSPIITLQPDKDNVEIDGDVVSFRRVTPESGGVYTVTANNEEGEDVAVIVLDIVGQSPQFVGSFNNLTLPHLTPHLIRASAFGLPAPEMTISKVTEDSEIVFKPKVVTTGTTSTASFTIDNPEVSDSGWYKVTASNEYGVNTTSAYLEFTTVSEEPEFVVGLGDARVKQGEPHEVSFVISGVPDPKVTLTKDGEPISFYTEPTEDGLKYIHQIPSVQPDDAGTYRAVATNEVGTAYSTAELDVKLRKRAPQFTEVPRDVTLTAGDDHTIVAEVTGIPKPNVYVVDEDGNVVGRGKGKIVEVDEETVRFSLDVDDLQPEDSGRYTIVANNGVGRPAKHEFDLEVELPESAPEITQIPRDATLTQGDDHLIEAEIKGVPKPNVYVTDKDGVFVGEGQIEEVDEETVRFSLDIPDLQPEDSGRYTITANNGVGRPATHEIYLEVEPLELAPQFTNVPRDLTLEEGDNHVIEAEIKGVPRPNLVVTDGNGDIVEGVSQIVKVDGETIRYSLEIPDIQVEEAGLYTITADNGVGNPASHKFDIGVEEPSEEPPSVQPAQLGKALNIITPLPAEIYITKGDDVDLSVKIEGTIESEDELSVTLYNSLRGLDTDLSKHLKWELSPVPNMPDQYELEATLPYPYSLNAGNLRLTIANEHGADDTETVLNIEEMGSDPPFFDPAPSDIKSYPNNNIMLETRVRGSRPVKIDWFVTEPGSGTPQPIIEGDGDKYEIHINGSLTIKDVGKEDEGTYLVQVSNSAGSATEEAEIEVTQTAGFSDWTDWTPCSADCEGTRTRSRFCNNPPPAPGYPSCARNMESESEECGAEQCPGFSEWSEWDECSKECGYGTRTRNRNCDSPPPETGGPQCEGLSVENKICYLKKCPQRIDGNWSVWSGWSDCSVPCGTGTKRKSRTCTNPVPSNGGGTCEGPGHEEISCVLKAVCKRKTVLENWNSWSECSAECGGGTKRRTRGSCVGQQCSEDEVQIRDCNTMDCARKKKKRLRSASLTISEPIISDVPIDLDIHGVNLCLSAKMVLKKLYTLVDTDSAQIYGTLRKDGTYSSLTIYSGLNSVTLKNKLNHPLPSSVGSVTIKQKNSRVVLIGDMFKLNVVQSDGEGFRVEIVRIDDEVTGFLGVLKAINDSSQIVDKSGKKKILRFKNVNYLLTRSKTKSCYELINDKYSARILGSTDKFLENDY
ncbi:uncharacterized protein LOC134820861 isoform X3 [Bolinopsis microptera]|uniref:uncharacterized protein LOC134820861 isoform X3 n=1 Tax=Bolinopsis microptera TaxID=2820187 RepID=UPI00307AFD5F